MARKVNESSNSSAALKAVEDALEIDVAEDLEADLAAQMQSELENDFNLDSEPAEEGDEDFTVLQDRLAEAATQLREESAVETTDNNESVEATESDSQKLSEAPSTSPDLTTAALGTVAAAGVAKASAVTAKTDDLLLETPIAANDDRRGNVADLVYSMQRKPSSRIFWVTALLSAVWIALCAFYGWTNYREAFSAVSTPMEYLQIPGLVLGLGILVTPLLMLWAFAILIKRSVEMRNAAQSMTEAAIRLLQPEKVASDSVSTVGRAVRREVSAISTGIERALARASELELMVQNEVINLERSYGDSEVRLRELIQEMGSEREAIVGHADRLKSSISETHTGLTQELEIAGQRIEETVELATRKMQESLDARRETVTTSLSDAGQKLVSLMSLTGENLQMKVDDSRAAFENSMVAKSAALNEQLETAGNAVANLLDVRTAAIRSQTEEATRALDETLTAKSLEMESRITISADTLNTALDEKISSIDASLNTNGQKLVGALGMRTEALDKVLAERTDKIGETISERLSGFGNTLVSHVDQTVAKIDERAATLQIRARATEEGILESTARLENTLAEKSETLASTLDTRTQAIDRVLADRTDKIGDTIGERLSGFGNRLTDHVDSTVTQLADQVGKLDQVTRSTEENLLTKAALIEQTVMTKAEGLTRMLEASDNAINVKLDENLQKIVDKSNEVGSSLETKAGQLNDTIDRGSQVIGTALDQKRREIEETLNEQAAAIGAGIEDGKIALGETLSEKTAILRAEIERSTQGVAEGIEAKRGELSETIESKTAQIRSDFEAQKQALDQTLAEKSAEVRETMTTGQEALTRSIDEQMVNSTRTLDEKATKIANVLSKRAEVINDTLGHSLVETQRSLEEKTAEFNRVLNERSRDLTSLIETHTKPLSEKLIHAGDDLKAKAAEVNTLLTNQAAAVMAKLGQQSAELKDLIAASSSNLAALSEGVEGKSIELAGTVAKATENLVRTHQVADETTRSLSVSSENLLQNINTISERFDHQGKTLSDATRIIDAAQSNLETTLVGRQAALENLATDLVRRSDEIERTMGAFTAMIQTALDKSTQQSQGIGKTVAEEINAAIENSTTRFAQASNEMRQTSKEVQRELEETRALVKKGVMELPDETRQSADAMRRVVADQISALNDLSRIVEKSGNALEAGRAVKPQYFTPQPVPSPSKLQQQPAAPVIPQTNAVPPPAPTNTVAFPPQTVPQASIKQPVMTNAATAPDLRGALDEQQEGSWMNNLLRRAEQEENTAYAPRSGAAPAQQVRSPSDMVDSLNSLSMDIARAIDHETSVDLWQRYQRGESNVFTRRLYTLQGQQKFDEIRNKFANDSDFRNAVNRYIDDFERLLAEVAKNDRDGTTTQNYLTSDTGKVYTMLAHAAGRFSN